MKDIKGLDLKIDQAVQNLCDAYNKSSGSTRSVLYFLLLINILSLIAVINSHKGNWSDNRIASLDMYIRNQYELKQSKEQEKPLPADMLKHQSELHLIDYRLNLHKNVREYNIRNKIDRYQNVQIPILGNSFDINNLGIISGISFIVLLTILRFTLMREKNNLRIALQSISERYYDGVIEDEFIEKAKMFGGGLNEAINQINKVRRKHHYNFLSMNEVFNLPVLEVSDNTFRNTFFGKIVTGNLFYFPYFTYLAIFMNDLIILETHIETSFWHTIISLSISYLCLSAISYLCKYCNFQKRTIDTLFFDFYKKGYVYERMPDRPKKETIINRLLHPVAPLHKIVVSVIRMSSGRFRN